MKKVLIVLADLLKNSEPNAMCMNHIADCWDESEVKADYLSLETEKRENGEQNIFCLNCGNNNGPIREMKRKAFKLLNMPLSSRKNSKRTAKKIEELLKIKSYDTVIAVMNPIEAADAVYQLKKKVPQMNTILYEIDPASNRYKTPKSPLERYCKRKSEQWEQRVYHKFDTIIHMKSHKQHFSNEIYKQFEEKTQYLDVPAMGSLAAYKEELSPMGNKVNFIYAGAFYKGLREPYNMLDTMGLLRQKREIALQIYTTNHMYGEIETYISQRKEYCQLYPCVMQNELDRIMEKMDILLSVGNYDSDFLPSKIFYYIGSGKPVIHFAADKEDVAIPYLLRYPRALVVMDTAPDEEKVSSILAFMEKIIRIDVVKREVIQKEYIQNMPEYSADIMKNYL